MIKYKKKFYLNFFLGFVSMERYFFGILAIIVSISDLVLTFIILKKRNKKNLPMAITFFLTAVVAITYYISAISTNYFVMSLFSSIYFSGITVMVMALLYYIDGYTDYMYNKHRRLFGIILHLFGAIDVIIQMINPFYEISIHYTFRPDSIAMWKYEPGILYINHLIYCYVVISIVFALLLVKALRTPKAYRPKYMGILYGLLFVVALNGVFLILQNENMLDYSILFYSLISSFIFWDFFYYSRHGMLNRVRQLVLDDFDQPVMLFDSDNQLVMRNNVAKKFLKEYKEVSLEEFGNRFDFPIDITKALEDVHFQWNYAEETRVVSYRVDVKTLNDHKHRIIGKMIVMTDTSLEMDLLTGFHSKNSFEAAYKLENPKMIYPTGVAICDLNKLTEINRSLGKQKGDLAIQKLSKLMVKYFPKDSYFARLEDANLLAICPGCNEEQMRNSLQHIRQELETIADFNQQLDMQCAVSIATKDKPSIMEATDITMFSVRSKKLMDGSSAHSSLLDSLAQTLLESDDTTRAHVERTKNMGEMLGKRLGFTDAQQSELALLCLLHDIGKLGVPLEILNKPGKLNGAEWDVMKSHVEKGYRIAQASSELSDIADLIRHHHESWNGKGYPDGLKQEAIPLLSRVIAIVDTYDAMTNDRPYHKAVSDFEARKELKRCAGVQFDPTIVSQFLELLEELHPITPEEKDQLSSGAAIANSKPDYSPRGVSEIFEQEIHESENVKEIIFTKYVITDKGLILRVDDNFETLTGYTREDIEKYKLTQENLIPNEDIDFYLKKQRELASKNTEIYIEHRIIRKDGSIRNVACFGKTVFDSVTRRPAVEIFVFDLSTTNSHFMMQKNEREIAQRSFSKFESLMRKDSLTGLLNHEAFINDVEIELLKKDQKTVLMILDIDFFKNYNDTFGHLAGDRMLALLAVILETSVRDIGFAGRLGGDEFGAVVLLPEDIPDANISVLVGNIFNHITETASAQEYPASITLGAAYVTEDPTFNKLYQAADRKLYNAKEKGRKCFCF